MGHTVGMEDGRAHRPRARRAGGSRAVGGAFAAAAATLLAAAPGAHAAEAPPKAPGTHDTLVVSNNWDGTADVVDPHTNARLKRLNVIPDKDERIAELMLDPAAFGYYLGIRQLVGEGHDQYVDDAFTSKDGRTIFVSRPSFADVVALDVGTGRITWRTKVDGNRADHMAISADGERVLVSASTANVVQALDTTDGREVGRWTSGDQPHENQFSRDGSRIFHASIGTVFTPTDSPEQDATKGKRVFQVVDAKTYDVLEEVDIGKKLAEAGYPRMSSSVRPIAMSPDERFAYMQVSFFHGFVEYDMREKRVRRVANLPITAAGSVPREQYVLDSAHHGIAMDPTGEKLCVAGTMSDYAAIVSRRTFAATTIPVGDGGKPYWSTNSADGKHCFVSISGDDSVSVISYATEREVARIPVGDHPQRMRTGAIDCDVLPAGTDCAGPRITAAKAARRGSGWAVRVRMDEAATLRIAESRRTRGGKVVRTRPVERQLKAGTTVVRLPKRTRAAGLRRLALTAVDAHGNVSALRRATYRVPRR